MKHSAPTPHRYRTQARAALFHSSNWISALLVTYAVMLMIFCAVYLTDSLFFLLTLYLPIPHIVRIGFYLVLYLLFSPLFVGLLCYYTDLYRAAHGDISSHVPPAVIFTLYGSPRAAVRAWGQVLIVLLLCALIPIAATPALIALRFVFTESTGIFPAVVLMLGGITATLSVLYFHARLMPFLYLSVSRPALSFFDAVHRSWRLSADCALTGVLLQLGLLASAVFSVLFTAGILFFLYILPIAIFIYVSFCHELSRRSDLF